MGQPTTAQGSIVSKIREVGAGLLASVVAIPQCVALGVTAFAAVAMAFPALVQVTGFYSAILAGLVVAVLGRGQMSMTGPRIGSAIVIAGAMAAFARGGGEAPPAPAAVLGLGLLVMLIAGGLQWLLGRLRLASLHDYIARPVVVGLLLGVAGTMVVKQAAAIGRGGPAFAGVALVTALLALVAVWQARTARQRGILWLARTGPVLAPLAGIAVYAVLTQAGIAAGPTLQAVSTLNVLPDVITGWQAAGAALMQRHGLLGEVVSAALMLAAVASIDTTNTYANTRQKLARRGAPAAHAGDDENNELRWHGLGNGLAALAGGITSSASEARATPAIEAGGRGWLTGLAYVAGLAILVGVSPVWPWMSAFPLAVVAGLMLQIALVLLHDQWPALRRYYGAWRDAVVAATARPGDAARRRQVALEVSLNGVAVLAVAASLAWYDPLRALAVGMLASMVLFLVKIGASQRHHCYRADARVSLERRDGPARETALAVRRNCFVIKLHGDFFFLSRKTVDALIAEVGALAQEGLAAGRPQAVIVDFDMAHEFDESGIAEIAELVRRLHAQGFVVLLAYLPSRAVLKRLLQYEGLVAEEAEDGEGPPARAPAIVAGHVFESTERAINYLEDEAIARIVGNDAAPAERPAALDMLATIAPVRTVGGLTPLAADGSPVRYWVVLAGKVTLSAPVRFSVAEAVWNKVIAEVGPFGAFSAQTLALAEVQPCFAGGTAVVPLSEAWLAACERQDAAQAAALYAYLLGHFADANALLQVEARMLDH